MKRMAAFLGSILLAACVAPSAEDAETSDDAVTSASRPRVLALGDSMAFAWDPTLERDPSKVDATRYRGYAEFVADRKIDLNQPAVTYCQGGGRAAVLAFGLELMGAKSVKNYYKSWGEWGNATDTPVEVPKK